MPTQRFHRFRRLAFRLCSTVPRPLPVLSAGGVLVVGALGVAACSSGSSRSGLAVTGSLSLIGGGGYTHYEPCYGTGNGLIDNSDMTSSTAVEVLDASGTIVGTGVLGPGSLTPYTDATTGLTGTSCRFAFTIPLDHASPHYQLIIGTRRPYDFSDPTGVDVSIGGSR